MKELTNQELQTKKLTFIKIPYEFSQPIEESIVGLLTTKGMEQFMKGKMTILDWKYKADMIIDLLK